jgi:hypothetical protein
MPIILKTGRSIRFIGSLSLVGCPMFLILIFKGTSVVQRLVGVGMVLFGALFGYWGRYRAGGSVTLSEEALILERFGTTRRIPWSEIRRVAVGLAHAPPGIPSLAVAVASDGWRFTLTTIGEPSTIELLGSDFFEHSAAKRALLAAFTARGLIIQHP